ncbi:hypothetical protein FPOAC1_000089 [Fusarium poae]|uniref:hypothetical protein n=1 Tax=Fusarium poae TaxID=36050 RepID=UPI001CE91262|nr:hypothetical protein FPOAC1_000089 [Fusarium poae]KAG8674126.1 hypothetical protein FPOAC1_000089 [Fusarium poae]
MTDTTRVITRCNEPIGVDNFHDSLEGLCSSTHECGYTDSNAYIYNPKMLPTQQRSQLESNLRQVIEAIQGSQARPVTDSPKESKVIYLWLQT